MPTLLELGLGVVVFASTNLDDMLLLAAWFAAGTATTRTIVVGQLLGIGALVAASAIAALGALAVPDGAAGILGAVPLWLGLTALRRRAGDDGDDGDDDENTDAGLTPGAVGPLAIAAVTLANGGDNLGVYVPLFAKSPAAIPWLAALFLLLTLAWCTLARGLVRAPWLGALVRRYGSAALPFVLIGLGLWILLDLRRLWA